MMKKRTRLYGCLTVIVFVLTTCHGASFADAIIHDTFKDGDFGDGFPGKWVATEGDKKVTYRDGGMHIDTLGGSRTQAVLREVDGEQLGIHEGWSVRARLTPIAIDNGGWVGVGMTQLNHASIRIKNGQPIFVAGNRTTTDDVALEDPVIDEEFVVQIDAFNDTITGYAWRAGSPEEIVMVEQSFQVSRSFPSLFTHAGEALYHEAWVSTTPIPLPTATPMLQAGDADQDLDFDQLDLVQVQVAAKYLTGQPATWGEGDWDGAPGGEPGNPPAGDRLSNQLDVVAALGAGTYLQGPYAAIQRGGQLSDSQTSVVYDPSTGEVAVDAPAGSELTSINIDSATGSFTGDAAANLGGSFDNDADDNIFKATFGSSFGSLSFGNVAQAGLTEEFVLGDLTVVGSLAGGGDLGDVDLVYVPEPASALLLALGLAIGLLRFGRADR